MTRFGDNLVTSTVPIPPRRQPGHDTSTRNRREFKLNVTDPVQADASLRGLGACLIQQHKGKDQLIAFASKSLTDAETRYTNIERGTSSHRLVLSSSNQADKGN